MPEQSSKSMVSTSSMASISSASGPQGMQGIQGDQGPQGPQGPGGDRDPDGNFRADQFIATGTGGTGFYCQAHSLIDSGLTIGNGSDINLNGCLLRFDSASQTLKLIIGGVSFTVNMTQD